MQFQNSIHLRMATFLFSCMACGAAVGVSSMEIQQQKSFLFMGSHVPEEHWQSRNVTTVQPSSTQEDAYNDETPIKTWGSSSELPVTVEVLFAGVWIFMVAASPLVVANRELTKTEMYVFAAMWGSFLGGLILFTKVILFQSSHFETVRSLTIVECIYLLSQVLTTVGYGDITPAYPPGQVIVSLYILFSIVIIANVMSEVVKSIRMRCEAHAEKMVKVMFQWQEDLIEKVGKRFESPQSAKKFESPQSGKSIRFQRLKTRDFVASDGMETAVQYFSEHAPPLPWRSLVYSTFSYIMSCVIGVLFFVYYPGEDKSLLEAVYMSVITLSTVGFGAITPQTEAGKVFASFWMVFGSATLVWVVGAFTTLTLEMREREQMNPAQHAEEDDKLTKQFFDSERVDFNSFLKFRLVQANLVSEAEINQIEQAFLHLGPDSGTTKGTISKERAMNIVELEHKLCGSRR